jgi:hypothetical protein
MDFIATTHAATELAGSDVPRNLIAESLPKVAQVNLKRMGLDPAKVSDEYDRSKQEKEKVKPIAQTIHTKDDFLVVLKVKSRFARMVTKLLAEMFDVHLATLDEGIATLSAYKNKKRK